jgi:hypothetical protein
MGVPECPPQGSSTAIFSHAEAHPRLCSTEWYHMVPPYGMKTSRRAWPMVTKNARLPAWRGQAAATRPVRTRLVCGHLSGPASPSSPSAGGAPRLAGRLGPSLVAAPCSAAGQDSHNICRLTGASWAFSTQPQAHLQLHHLRRACSAAKARGRHQQGTSSCTKCLHSGFRA